MKGLRQYKKRNAGQNERRAIWSAFQAAAAKTYQLKRVFREDLQTNEITESSRSKMNAEVGFWFNAFDPLKSRLALPQSLVWEELEGGAMFFTGKAMFWIENARPAPAAAIKSQPDCEDGEFYRSGEIDLHYENIVTEPCGCVYERDGVLNPFINQCAAHRMSQIEEAAMNAECEEEYRWSKYVDSTAV